MDIVRAYLLFIELAHNAIPTHRQSSAENFTIYECLQFCALIHNQIYTFTCTSHDSNVINVNAP